MSSIFRQIARTSHQVSKYSGDAAAFQSGGVPRLAKRLIRRQVTRTLFRALGNGR